MKVVRIMAVSVFVLVTAFMIADRIVSGEFQSTLLGGWVILLLGTGATLFQPLCNLLSSRQSAASLNRSEESHTDISRLRLQVATFMIAQGMVFALLGGWGLVSFLNGESEYSGLGLLAAIGAAPVAVLLMIGAFRLVKSSSRSSHLE